MSLRATAQAGDLLLSSTKQKTDRPTHLIRAVRRLGEAKEQGRSLSDIEQIQRSLLGSIEAGDLSHELRCNLRDGARAYLSEPLPIGRNKSARRVFLHEIDRRQLRSAILGLVNVYLEQFGLRDEAIRDLAGWLESKCPSWTFRKAEVWKERRDNWKLFRPDEGPALLAAKALAHTTPKEILSEAGLGEHLGRSGYCEAAFSLACKALVARGRTHLQLMQDRLIAWSNRDGKFSYDRLWPEYAKVLVEPWEIGGNANQLTPEHKTKLINELIGYAGDPRTGSKSKWSMLDGTRAKDIVIRWLTRASVLQFLDIVDRTADKHMWSYRRAFWTSYLLADYIDAAWVAFGQNGAMLAMEAARRNNDESMAQFGCVQKGTGRSADHAALILKIGDLTIVDWSHNGKYNIWYRGNKGAPELFQRVYSGYSLSSGKETGSHVNSGSFLWQGRIAQEIRTHTGRRVPPDNWSPRRGR